ncbi:MAG: EamA/RhaT family transporter [Oscillospiraceae bacterium]|nr:MAG: EamA/RhaT family transporter [Oscillospiraceae bacterium]
MLGRYKGIFLVICSAVLFGCMPLMANIIYEHGGTPVTLTLMRNFLALPFLWLLMRRSGKPMALRRQDIFPMFLLSLGFVGTPVLLFSSYRSIPSGMATTIHFVYPVFVLLGCVLFCRERLSRVKTLCVALCTCGILLFYTPGDTAGLSGILLAFLSGITYAFYIIYLGRCRVSQLATFTLAFWLCLFSSADLLLYLAATGGLQFSMSPLGWGLCFFFAVSITVGASVSFQVGVKEIGAQRAAILSTFEPITSIVIGIVVFSEPFGIKTAAGVLSILAAVMILTLFDHEKAAA